MATNLQNKDMMVIQTYGNNEEIKSLAQRIKIMVPGGRNLKDEESQALAQVSLVTQCNPFIGEIWYIPGRGPMIGIKGARRHGNETVKKAGGDSAYFTADLKPCAGEVAGYKGDVKDLAAAYECTVEDSVSTKLYQVMFLETLNALRAAGSPDPVGESREICGKRPQWKGYGFSTVSESSKMNKQALAMKRAEADALKHRFDIPFGTEVAAGDSAGEVEGAWVESPRSSVIDADSQIVLTYDQAKQVIVHTKGGAEKFMSELSADQLNRVYLSPDTTQEQKDAAVIILKTDFQMEPPTA